MMIIWIEYQLFIQLTQVVVDRQTPILKVTSSKPTESQFYSSTLFHKNL